MHTLKLVAQLVCSSAEDLERPLGGRGPLADVVVGVPGFEAVLLPGDPRKRSRASRIARLSGVSTETERESAVAAAAAALGEKLGSGPASDALRSGPIRSRSSPVPFATPAPSVPAAAWLGPESRGDGAAAAAGAGAGT
jgi:hypothetical protein